MEKLNRIDLQLFADGDDPNAGGGKDGGDSKDNSNAGDKGGKKVEFTPEQQAELDRIVQERLTRAEKAVSKKALEARAKELGFNTVDEMEAALKAHKETQEKSKTDLEKEKEARTKAEATAKTAQERANKALLKAAFFVKAKEAGAVNADDAFALANLSEVTVSEEGVVDDKLLDEAVKKLAKAKPYLFSQGDKGGAWGNRGKAGDENNKSDLAKRFKINVGKKE